MIRIIQLSGADFGGIEQSPTGEVEEGQGHTSAQDTQKLKNTSIIHTHTQMEDSHTPYPIYTAPNGEKVSIAGTPGSRFIVWTQAARRMKATTTLTAPPVPKRIRIPSQIRGYLMGVFGPRAYQVSGMCIPMEDAKPPMKNRKE